MTCKECGQVVKLTRTMNKCHSNTELSSLEETRSQFNGGRCAIKLGIDVHQDFYVVVMQEGGSNPKPPQRFRKRSCTGRPNSREREAKCMPSMKRVGLVFLCRESSARSRSSATWSARRSWMSKIGG